MQSPSTCLYLNPDTVFKIPNNLLTKQGLFEIAPAYLPIQGQSARKDLRYPLPMPRVLSLKPCSSFLLSRTDCSFDNIISHFILFPKTSNAIG